MYVRILRDVFHKIKSRYSVHVLAFYSIDLFKELYFLFYFSVCLFIVKFLY